VAKIAFKYSGNVYDAAPAGTVDFPLITPNGNNIPYLEKTHIHVYSSADAGVTWTEMGRPSQWDFDSSGTVVRLKAAVTPDWVMVRRLTPYDNKYTTFQDSSLLTAEQLNEGENFSMYVDQELYDLESQGFLAVPSQVVTIADQKKPSTSGLASAGWPLDDTKIATTGAIAERFDVIMSDTKPADPPLSEYRQGGKFWLDTSVLQMNYWDPGARAWVNIGQSGPAGTIRVGGTTTAAPGTNAVVVNSGTSTAAVFDFTIPRGDVGATGPAGPSGPQGPAGPQGPLPTLVGHAPIDAHVVSGDYDLSFNPIPLTYLP
jgi:hypothetical protein